MLAKLWPVTIKRFGIENDKQKKHFSEIKRSLNKIMQHLKKQNVKQMQSYGVLIDLISAQNKELRDALVKIAQEQDELKKNMENMRCEIAGLKNSLSGQEKQHNELSMQQDKLLEQLNKAHTLLEDNKRNTMDILVGRDF